MAIDYNQRPAGMSKREYAASILGGSKEDYDSSGNKKSASSSSSKSSSSSSSYKPVTYDYKNFVDTKPVAQAYDSAKGIFTDQLTALKPRYEELYKQLQASQDLAAEKEAQLAGQELTQQKAELAKRGISTDTGNTYYNTEAGKLQQQQIIRSKETALDFAGKRLDIAGAESEDTRNLSTSIANLDLTKATSIASMITDAKKTAATLNSSELDRVMQDSISRRSYQLGMNNIEANKTLELYKLARTETNTKNTAYNSAFAAAVANAYNPENGIVKPYTRERVQKVLESEFPDMKEQIKKDIADKFPDGWESMASGGSVDYGDEGFSYSTQ